MIRSAPWVLLLALVACDGARAAAPDGDLFAGHEIPKIHVFLDEEALASLDAEPKEYARGSIRVGGALWRNVGIRIKGNRSRQSFDGKPALKLHFGKYDEDARFFGVEKLSLNNMVEDPTMVRETLAYALHRAAGVPAPRTAYAQVFVNRRPYGLYLMVESVDEVATGNLYEGSFGCDLYEDDVAGFEQDGGDDESRADLAALAAAASGPVDALFGEAGPLDRARVLAYLAVSAYIGDFDGYRHGHNYRIHHDPASGTWTFLPWGLDRSFKKHLAIFDSGGLVAKRCFADAACRAEYERALEEVVRIAETLDLPAEADRVAATIDRAVRLDPRRPFGIDEVEKRREQLRRFLAGRAAEIRAEIASQAGPPAPPDPAATRCPEVVVDGVAFALCDLPMTWAEASQFCAAQGFTLARLDGDAQSRAVAAAAKASRKKKSKWWIGATDRPEEDAFRWTDGTPLGFTSWAKGEPDNDACNQDCAALGEKGTGAWNDTHCASRLPFVCRK